MNSFWKGIEHAIASFVLFGVPFVLMNPGWSSITVGSVLTGLYAWARVKVAN